MSKLKFYPERSNGYEELMGYYPRYYRGVLEMEALLHYFGSICDDFEAQTEQAYLNNFILAADAETIKSWENALHITYTEQLSLDQRRSVVIGRLSGNGHIGEPEIRLIISAYTQAPVTVDFARGIITVVIAGGIFGEDNLLDTLLRRIPAHLALNMSAEIHRTFRLQLPISYGGATGAEYSPQPVDVKRASTERRETSGGLFYHTRITSKLIE